MTDKQDEILGLLERAQSAFSVGDAIVYRKLLAEAREQSDALTSSDRMLGEWELMAWLEDAFDADALLAHLRRAYALLGGRRSAIQKHLPLNLGTDSMLSMFYLRSDLDVAVQKTREMATLYHSMTGCGLGYDLLLETEINYNRCKLDTASVLAHQVVYTARNTGQPCLAANGAKYLAQIAKHRGDADGWTYAIHVINAAVKETAEDARAQNSIHLTRYELSTILGDIDALPSWLRDGILPMERMDSMLGLGYRLRDDAKAFYCQPIMIWTHALYLVMTGQFDRLLAVNELQHTMGADSIPVLDLYFAQTRALCLLRRGDRTGAKTLMQGVVDRVAPERMWMYVAELSPLLDGIVEELVEEQDPGALDTLLRIARGIPVNSRKILKSVSGVHAIANLTEREREVADLAATGLSNQEIAKKLCITQQTVKFHLGNVYHKLSVSSRSRMAALLRNE